MSASITRPMQPGACSASSLSGVLYQLAGIEGCLIGSAVMLVLCCLAITFVLPTESPNVSDFMQSTV